MFISEVFNSIMGEACDAGQGAWTTFVRLAGCNLNCWGGCDTPQAMRKGQGISHHIENMMMAIMNHAADKTNRVLFTGGEPLLQASSLMSLACMLSENLHISIETNGSVPWDAFLSKRLCDCIIADYKCPSSGMSENMLPIYAFQRLRSCDWIKFVIQSKADFDFACEKTMAIKNGGFEGKIAFSPFMGGDLPLHPKQLFDWMDDIGFHIPHLSVQIHKLIGVD